MLSETKTGGVLERGWAHPAGSFREQALDGVVVENDTESDDLACGIGRHAASSASAAPLAAPKITTPAPIKAIIARMPISQ